MLKWTSKGSLNSEDSVHNVIQNTPSWHKLDGVHNSFRRSDPGRGLLTDVTDQRKMQLLNMAASNVSEVTKQKHSMRSEPNSPRGSTGDVRQYKSMSLPSSPQARKKQKYGVFKKLKNIFRKSKNGDPEILTQDFFIKKNMMAPGPSFHNKDAKIKVEKKNLKGKKGVPNTRLTRLIEAKREQRKSLPTAEEYRSTVKESSSFFSPSASSDEDGIFQALHPQHESQHGYLETFLANNLNSFDARAGSPMDRVHVTEMNKKRVATPGGVSPTVMSRAAEEPIVIARVIPRFEDEFRIPNASPMRSSDDETDSLLASQDNIWKELAPSKVESFILDGNRYEYITSPTQPNQANLLDKHINQGGVNGISRPVIQNKGIKQGNDTPEEISLSSASIKEMTRSLSFIKESGSLEKVRVMFSSPESIVHARACLHPKGAGRQSPSSKSVSTNSIIVNTLALCDDNDQWSFPDAEQTLMSPNQNSSMNDLFFKEEGDVNPEYNNQNPPCTRNNNNGHHTSPLVIPTTFYDLQPDVNETLFESENVYKTSLKPESFDFERNKVTKNEEPFDKVSKKSANSEKPDGLTKNTVETNIEPFWVTKKKEKNVQTFKEDKYLVETFKSISVMNSSPSPKYATEALKTSSTTALSDSNRSDSDTKSSPLNVDHQSLLAIRPMKVKDIVDQIERESLSSVPRYSPVERSAEKLPKGAEMFRNSGEKKRMNETTAITATPDLCSPVTCTPEPERLGVTRSSDTDLVEEREFSADDNFSFSLDDDVSSKSDVAERELMLSESSSFQMSDQIVEMTNTYASDTNAFCSDNSDALTSSSCSKGVEEMEQDPMFAPVVHLVCNSMIDSVCCDMKSDKDCREEMILSEGVNNPCVDITQSADTAEITEMDATFLVSTAKINVRPDNAFTDQEQSNFKHSPVPDDRIKIFHSTSTEKKVGSKNEEESCLSISDMNTAESVAGDQAASLIHDSCKDEEGIMDVIAPELTVMTDSSLKELISETLENKSALTETNAILQDLNASFKDDQDTEMTISAGNGEISMPVNVPPGPDNNVFYMPSCALEEFSDAWNNQKTSKENKMKKKVSFNLEVASPEESSASDDRAVLETTLPSKQGQAEMSLDQGSEQEFKGSPESSTDVSMSDLSARSSDLQVGLTPPVTSTSGDDFSWWGTENIEELDFFHDKSPVRDKGQALAMNTDVARSNATENLLHEEKFLNRSFGETEDLPEEDLCGASNILTLSSFLTSGSIFNKGGQEKDSFFLAADNEAEQLTYLEIANDASKGSFDDKSWLHSDVYSGDTSVNKQSESEDDKRQKPAEEILSKESNKQQMSGKFDEGDDQPEMDLTSDINTHTYNVTRQETPEDKDGLAWWEKCPGSSATNYSLGSFEIDSHDESNTLSEIYNQLKKPNKTDSRTTKKRSSVLKKRFRVTEANKQKSLIKKKSPQKVSQPKKAITSKTNKKVVEKIQSKIDVGSVEMKQVQKSPQKSSPENQKNEDKVSKHKKNVSSSERKSRFLDRNDADREQKSITEHSKPTKRSTVTPESIELKTEAAVETDSSAIPQRIRALANKKDKPVKIEKTDSVHNIVQTTSSRKSNRNRTLWTKSSSESISNVSDYQCASDDDCRVKFYSHDSPYFIDNLNECVSSYASTGGMPYVSLSNQTQYATESCVIDNFADNDSSLDISETSTELLESNSPVYKENSKGKIGQSVTDDCAPDKIVLNYVHANNEICNSLFKVPDPSKDHETMNHAECPNQTPRDHFKQQKEAHRNSTVFLSRIEPSVGFHSSKSQTMAVAESDTTTATDMFNSDNTMYNMRQMYPGNNGQGLRVNQNVEFTASDGQMKQTIQQSAVMGASTRPTGRHQQSDFYDHHGQNTPQPHDQGEAWHQRSRFGGSGGGDTKSRRHIRRDVPDTPPHAGSLETTEVPKAETKPGEWLFIASFFVFQLFMHWMYAA